MLEREGGNRVLFIKACLETLQANPMNARQKREGKQGDTYLKGFLENLQYDPNDADRRRIRGYVDNMHGKTSIKTPQSDSTLSNQN